MARGVPNKRYTGEFKQHVIESMHKEGLGYQETERQFEITKDRVRKWERIYLEEGPEGLYVERRGKAPGGKQGSRPKLDKKVEEDLIAEVQRLRAENDYLKNLHALVQERERRERKPK